MNALNVNSPALHILARHPLPPLSRALLAVTLVVVQWDLRRRTRKDLLGLPDYMLKDIGLDPTAAMHEVAKPFWRA